MVDGLTGFFDDDLHNTMKTGFPFAQLFGGNISEFKVVDNLFECKYGSGKSAGSSLARIYQQQYRRNTFNR
jgi:beta-galactosidase